MKFQAKSLQDITDHFLAEADKARQEAEDIPHRMIKHSLLLERAATYTQAAFIVGNTELIEATKPPRVRKEKPLKAESKESGV